MEDPSCHVLKLSIDFFFSTYNLLLSIPDSYTYTAFTSRGIGFLQDYMLLSSWVDVCVIGWIRMHTRYSILVREIDRLVSLHYITITVVISCISSTLYEKGLLI